MWEAKAHFFLGVVITALLQKMPHGLGCCLQGNPKTEVTGSVAGSKETDRPERRRQRTLRSPHSPGTNPRAVLGQKTGDKDNCSQAEINGAEKPSMVGPQMAAKANSFQKPKSRFESPFRGKAP